MSRIKKVKSYENAVLTKHNGADRPLFIVVFVVMCVHCFSLILPYVWLLMTSVKDPMEYMLGKSFALPENWLFSNYIDAFKMLNIGKTSFFGLIFNSVWETAIGLLLGTFMPCTVGYVLSKYRFPGRNLLYAVCIFMITVPLVGTGAAHMKIVTQLGLYNSPLYLVVTGLCGFGGMLLYYGYFQSVSWTYAESAMLDGANPWVIFFRIMFPQALPLIFTCMITGFISRWNDYYTQLMYLPDYPTLAYGLYEYKENAARLNYPVYYAGLIIAAIPPIIIFASFSDKIMTSVSIGGIKG